MTDYYGNLFAFIRLASPNKNPNRYTIHNCEGRIGQPFHGFSEPYIWICSLYLWCNFIELIRNIRYLWNITIEKEYANKDKQIIKESYGIREKLGSYVPFTHWKIHLFIRQMLFTRKHVHAKNSILEKPNVIRKFDGTNIALVRKPLK